MALPLLRALHTVSLFTGDPLATFQSLTIQLLSDRSFFFVKRKVPTDPIAIDAPYIFSALNPMNHECVVGPSAKMFDERMRNHDFPDLASTMTFLILRPVCSLLMLACYTFPILLV
ncbi:hypothetical protein AMTR_s00098p00127580 [Amborella trichopoda]|uniref:Uncharacterized protein n=1 Tax=Amborella trichopoda TaxID=13333 RepID=W1NS54_AMBTC|nr:hypothetical protein AMTR_s00098p00127580 [Amborella trichopoda]